ncbi:MAG TPA: hypothetical protein PK509_09520 [Catalimonadaceae bacterium]|nr:hypothetical protein [Catalimonadaceae bacterium]
MRKSFYLFLLTMMSFGLAQAQEQVTYTITKNDPENYHPKFSLNLMLFGLETSFQNIEATSFYSSLFGHVLIHDRLGIQYNLQRSWLTLAKLGNKDMPTADEYQAGAMFFLTKNSRVRKEKIILKSREGTFNGRRVTTTSLIMVPGNVIKYFGFRGGLYHKGTAYNLKDNKILDGDGLDLASMRLTGIYAGIISRKLSHIIVNIPGTGKRFKSLGFDFYLDAMLQAHNSFILREDPYAASNIALGKGDDITDLVTKAAGNKMFGYRIGINGFQIGPKADTDKKFGMCYNFEAGMMPYLGYYVKGGIGMTLFKK